jgi:hypothetical protein
MGVMDDKLLVLEKSVDSKFISERDNRQNLAASMERRLEAMNEFRSALQDQSRLFFTRSEHEAFLKSIDSDMRSVRENLAGVYPRVEHEAYIKSVEADLRTLREFRANLEGKASQSSVTISLILAAISLLTGITSVIIAVFRTLSK